MTRKPIRARKRRRDLDLRPSLDLLEGRALMAPLNVLVTNPADDGIADTQSETSILAFTDSKGQQIVLAGYNDSGSTEFDPDTFNFDNHFTGYSRSTDGGLTFTDLGRLPDSDFGDAGDPILVRDNTSGTIYYATLSFDNSNRIEVFRSFDDGVTFEQPVNGTPGFTNGFMDKQWLDVDNFEGEGQGNVYMLTRNFGAGGGQILTRSTDGGATWGPDGGVFIAEGSSNNVQGANVVVGPDHAVYAIYYEQVVGDNTQQFIKLRKSTDFGLTFADPVTLTTLSAPGFFNGDLGLGDPYYRSNSFPQVEVNPVSGDLYLTYNDNPEGADRGDVFVRRSTDGGSTWSDPVRVNDDPGTSDQYMPTLAVTPDGSRLGVFFYDRRLGQDRGLIDYFAAIAPLDTDSESLEFGANYRITDQSFGIVVGADPILNQVYMGDYDTVVADDAFFYVNWGDNRDDSLGRPGKQANVRFAKVSVDAVGPEVITISPEGDVTATPVRNIRVTFNQTVDIRSISKDDFKLTRSDGTVIPITGLKYVLGTKDTQFDLKIPGQSRAGEYTLTVSDEMFGLRGTQADHDLDGVVDGLATGAEYRFRIDSLKAVASETLFNDEFEVTGVRVTFNKGVRVNSFRRGDVVVTGPDGPIPVTSVTPVPGSDNTRFDITIPAQSEVGFYSVAIGPNILDTSNSLMDQDGDFNLGEVPDDIFFTGFGIFGPFVVASDPNFNFVSPPATTVAVTFNKVMDVSSFDTSDVVVTAPDGSSVEVTDVEVVDGSNDTSFLVTFAPVTAGGFTSIAIGPDITDAAGNAMDQDGDFILGEVPDDVYNTGFFIEAPRIFFTLPFFEFVQAGISEITVFFTQTMDPSTFDGSDVDLTAPDGSAIPIDSVDPVPDSNDSVFTVTFAPQGDPGIYAVVIGPDIRNVAGTALDQDFDGITGEDPDDTFFNLFGIAANFVVFATPTTTFDPVASFDLTFNLEVDPTTFDATDVSLTDAEGNPIEIESVDPVDGTGNTVFRVSFAEQTAIGVYNYVVGPDILDTFGNPMDQDFDFVLGEPGEDAFTSSFRIAQLVPYEAEEVELESIELLGDPDAFTIIEAADDFAPFVDLAGNTFTFYDVEYTGIFVSSNGLITFSGSEATFFNQDLNFSPFNPGIAVLWDDWYGFGFNNAENPMVLGKFEDVDSDGTADRLIVEWNQVEHFTTSFTGSFVTFQAILELNTGADNGDVKTLYPDLDMDFDFLDNGGSATVGIKDSGDQSATPSNKLLISFNESSNPLVQSGQSIRFFEGDGDAAPIVRGTAMRRQTALQLRILNGQFRTKAPVPTPAGDPRIVDLALDLANEEGTGTLSNGVLLPSLARLRRQLGLS